jgi:hypothetical protein
MANGTSTTNKRSFPEMMNGVSVNTSKKHILKLNPIQANMLELDDVLYHTNSAVLMPEIPQTASSGTKNTVTGLRAIALGLKQIEFDPRLSILIAAHTDTEGDADTNFDLSKKRGIGIYTLMTSGRREDWAENSKNQHVIEDYQQILKYMFDKHGWAGCDPGSINNSWNAKTKSATEAFIDKYNTDMVHGSTPPLNATEIDKKIVIYAIEHDWKHLWVIELWRAVYDIYIDDIVKALNVDRALLDSRYRSKAKFLTNINNEPYLGCGESHPIDQAHKNDYRSLKNRRVEIYFFNGKAMKNAWPLFLKWWLVNPCPIFTKKVHGPDICPLWHNLLFKKLPIDEADLTCVGYHLKFYFWERKTGTLRSMPDGLQIDAYSDIAETNNLNARVSYMSGDGIYLVKVPDDNTRTHIHFSFNSIQGTDTSPRWVHLKPGKAPNTFTKSIVSENQISLQNSSTPLAGLPFDKQLEYYDVPARWSSINYHTRYDNDFDKGDKFEEVLKTKKLYKPYGKNITSPTGPLAFSLDDIVLLDAVNGTQAIRDADHHAVNLNVVPSGTNPPHYPALSANSRVKIFIADKTTGRPKLYKAGAADITARIPFPSNYIAVKSSGFSHARIVFFRDGFYTIGWRRTTAITGWANNGFALGARAAVRNDTQFHQHWLMAWNNPGSPPEFHAAGDYDLHYFHNMSFVNNRPVSFLIKYVSISFIGDPRTGNTIPPWSPDITNFIDHGVYNSMNRWNVKPVFFEERTNTPINVVDPVLIFPFYFFDERETFHVAAANPANHPNNIIDFKSPAHIVPLWSHAEVNAAQTNAVGGRSRYMAFICSGIRAFQWEIRTFSTSQYSVFALDTSNYQESASKQNDNPEGNFGDLTFAHELGHAIGLVDEYMIDNFEIVQHPSGVGSPKSSTFISYDQAWEPYETYSPNNLAIMQSNYMPRMHHHWYVLHFFNSEIIRNNNNMNRFFPASRQFVLKDENRTAYIYTRGEMKMNSSHVRHIEKVAGMNVPLDCRTPMFRTPQYALPGTPVRHLSLALYDVGEDRSSREEFHSPQILESYKGVLTVKLMTQVEFEGGVNHAFWLTGNNLKNSILKIAGAWKNRSMRYRLINGPNGMQEIFVNFIPCFTSTADARTNFHINFLRSVTPATPAGQPKIFMNHGVLQIHSDFTDVNFMQYILGSSVVVGSPLNATTEMPSWRFLETWVRSQLGNSTLVLRTI